MNLKEKILSGARITEAEALALFDYSLPELGELAQSVRFRKHPEKTVTYVIDLNLNITNVCTADCGFCAFYKTPGEAGAFTLNTEEILEKVDQLVKRGGTQLLMQGGLNPDLPLSYYLEITKAVREKHPNLTIHAFSPPEIADLARRENLTYTEVLAQMKAAGLSSLPGGGAEILVDRVRNELSPKKLSADGWFAVMDAAHEVGLKSTATMMFGSIETREEVVAHLQKVRNHQDKTGQFRAFIPWSFAPAHTRFSEVIPAGGGDYLKILAISRIFLDNVENIGSGWLTEGMKVAQMGLHFGANDMGGVLHEEKVVEAAGVANRTSVEQMIRAIRTAGFTPVRRNTAYEVLEFHHD